MQFRTAALSLLILLATPLALWAVETKDIKFPIKNADPVTFSHEIHLKKYNNNCKICHNAIFNLKERKRFTMADMEKTKSCGACHTGVKAFSVADDKSCGKCHPGKPRNIEFKVAGVGETIFNHSYHLAKLNNACRSCHNGKVLTGGRVTMAQMEKGVSCGACHNDKKAFTVVGNCGKCHKGMKTREIVFKPAGITPVKFSHDVHTAAYACKECHTRVFPFKAGTRPSTMADMYAGKSCGTCHNGKTAFSAGDCVKCHKGFKPGDIKWKTRVGEAKFSHEFHLGMYKCPDCHVKIFDMRAGAKHYTMHQMNEGKSCGACHNGKDAFPSSGACDRCHNM